MLKILVQYFTRRRHQAKLSWAMTSHLYRGMPQFCPHLPVKGSSA